MKDRAKKAEGLSTYKMEQPQFMKQNKLYKSIVAPNSPVEGRVNEEESSPPVPPQKTRGKILSIRQKPQISSIPGISPKVRNRYRVVLNGDEILGESLTLDEALEMVRGGTR